MDPDLILIVGTGLAGMLAIPAAAIAAAVTSNRYPGSVASIARGARVVGASSSAIVLGLLIYNWAVAAVEPGGGAYLVLAWVGVNVSIVVFASKRSRCKGTGVASGPSSESSRRPSGSGPDSTRGPGSIIEGQA